MAYVNHIFFVFAIVATADLSDVATAYVYVDILFFCFRIVERRFVLIIITCVLHASDIGVSIVTAWIVRAAFDVIYRASGNINCCISGNNAARQTLTHQCAKGTPTHID
ncbi:MAG: hypothetical protein IKW19_02930, partial [Akkermansia sp.]|nr:hypothetical protein [Akkermansia sp.]